MYISSKGVVFIASRTIAEVNKVIGCTTAESKYKNSWLILSGNVIFIELFIVNLINLCYFAFFISFSYNYSYIKMVVYVTFHFPGPFFCIPKYFERRPAFPEKRILIKKGVLLLNQT